MFTVKASIRFLTNKNFSLSIILFLSLLFSCKKDCSPEIQFKKISKVVIEFKSGEKTKLIEKRDYTVSMTSQQIIISLHSPSEIPQEPVDGILLSDELNQLNCKAVPNRILSATIPNNLYFSVTDEDRLVIFDEKIILQKTTTNL